jgi:hypothetical protein
MVVNSFPAPVQKNKKWTVPLFWVLSFLQANFSITIFGWFYLCVIGLSMLILHSINPSISLIFFFAGLPFRLGFRTCVHVISYRNATVLCMEMGLRQSRAHCTAPSHIPTSYMGHITSCDSLGAPGRFEQRPEPSRASVWRWTSKTQRETVASSAGLS